MKTTLHFVGLNDVIHAYLETSQPVDVLGCDIRVVDVSRNVLVFSYFTKDRDMDIVELNLADVICDYMSGVELTGDNPDELVSVDLVGVDQHRDRIAFRITTETAN